MKIIIKELCRHRWQWLPIKHFLVGISNKSISDMLTQRSDLRNMTSRHEYKPSRGRTMPPNVGIVLPQLSRCTEFDGLSVILCGKLRYESGMSSIHRDLPGFFFSHIRTIVHSRRCFMRRMEDLRHQSAIGPCKSLDLWISFHF